jgi:hypothetical protein
MANRDDTRARFAKKTCASRGNVPPQNGDNPHAIVGRESGLRKIVQ